jgi:hypothetical protein
MFPLAGAAVSESFRARLKRRERCLLKLGVYRCDHILTARQTEAWQILSAPER